MLLIDQPYISDFLIKTIKENNIPVISTAIARDMISDQGLNWISEEEAQSIFRNKPDTALYTNSENAIGWIEKNLSFTKLPEQIQLFKNKFKFRELLQDVYPDFFFSRIKFNELRAFKAELISYPIIIKPTVGFFSLGVYKVDNKKAWEQTIKKIESDIFQVKGAYPKEVIDIEEFIIEACVEGKEYAVDCYFDKDGEPIILNILQHLFSSKDDLSDRVYSTSASIIEELKPKFEAFLSLISHRGKLKNFPAHIEIRMDKNENIFPIEVNPMRFGGWCTTGDLSWFAYGINSYQYFLNALKPDWTQILESRKDKIYSNVVLDNTTGYDFNKIKSFDYDLLLNDFQKPLDLRKLKLPEYPVFGFLFTETKAENERELKEILSADLKKYVKLK